MAHEVVARIPALADYRAAHGDTRLLETLERAEFKITGDAPGTDSELKMQLPRIACNVSPSSCVLVTCVNGSACPVYDSLQCTLMELETVRTTAGGCTTTVTQNLKRTPKFRNACADENFSEVVEALM